MIINKKTLSILTRSDKPNENWTDEDCYIIEDGTKLSNKILNNYPNIEYIFEHGEIKDVTILEPKEIEQPVSEIERLRADIDFLSLMTGVEL